MFRTITVDARYIACLLQVPPDCSEHRSLKQACIACVLQVHLCANLAGSLLKDFVAAEFRFFIVQGIGDAPGQFTTVYGLHNHL